MMSEAMKAQKAAERAKRVDAAVARVQPGAAKAAEAIYGNEGGYEFVALDGPTMTVQGNSYEEALEGYLDIVEPEFDEALSQRPTAGGSEADYEGTYDEEA